MNILIEDAESLEFLTENGRWTKKAEKGRNFDNLRDASAAAKTEPIRKFNIVGYFRGTEQFINMGFGKGTGAEAVPA